MAYFYYKKNFHGKWTPVKDTLLPGKGPERSAPVTSQVITLSSQEEGFLLAELEMIYPVDKLTEVAADDN